MNDIIGCDLLSETLNLKEYIFKKVKSFQGNQELYLNIVRQALIERKLEEEPDVEELINRLNDIQYAEYPMQLIINEAYASKRKDLFQRSFVNEVGYLLPGTDFITGIKLETKLHGMKIPFLTMDGKIKTLLKWSKSDEIHLGVDSNIDEKQQRKIKMPYYYKVNLRLEIKDDSRWGHQEILHYIDEIDPQSKLTYNDLKDVFDRLALSLDQFVPEIISEMNDRFIVLNAVRWGAMKPLTHWYKTGKQIQIKQAVAGDGTIDIKGQIEGTAEKITFEDEVSASNTGQPMIQQKHGSEVAPVHIPCFGLVLISDHETRNYANLEIMNATWGQVNIWLAAFNFMINKIQTQYGIIKKEDEKESPFAHLNNLYKGVPLYILGRISSIKEVPKREEDSPDQVSFWMNVTLLADENFLNMDDSDKSLGVTIETLLAEYPDIAIYRDLKEFKLTFPIPTPSNVKILGAEVDTSGTLIQAPTSAPTVAPTTSPIVPPTKARLIAKDPDYQEKVKAITDSQDLKTKFREWLGEMTLKFKNSTGVVHQKELGDDLIFILTQTGNIWNPKEDHLYTLTDMSIFDNQQGDLFKWFVKQQSSAIPTTPTKPTTKPYVVTDVKETEKILTVTATSDAPSLVGTITKTPTEEKPKKLTDEEIRKEYFQFFVDLNSILDKDTQTFDRTKFNPIWVDWAIKKGYMIYAYQDNLKILKLDVKRVREFNNALNTYFFEQMKPASWYYQKNEDHAEYFDLTTCPNCHTEKMVNPSTGFCFDCDADVEAVNEMLQEEETKLPIEMELEAKTVTQLRNLAKEKKLGGYSKMKKVDLIAMLVNHGTPLPSPEPTQAPVTTPETKEPEVLAANEIPSNLSEKEYRELQELEASIKEWKTAMPTMNLSFEELYLNYKGFFPAWVDESHKPIIDKMIEKIDNEMK